jgi:hypothetical protein
MLFLWSQRRSPFLGGGSTRSANETSAYGQYGHPGNCPCYTATEVVPRPYCPPPPSHCGPTPDCVRLVQTTVPGPNPRCRVTPTVTSYAPCQTTCRKGCGTDVSISQDLKEIHLLALRRGSNFRRLTIKQVRTVTDSVACPPVSTKQPSSCYTWTTTPVAPFCPGVTGCIEPDCIILKTQTLPPANPACPFTPVVTATPSCLPTCRDGCETAVTTVQAVATTV